MQTWTPFFPELLGGKWQRIFGVLLAKQSAPSTLSTVLVYTEGSEGVKWELGLTFCCPGKIGFKALGLGFGHWEFEKKVIIPWPSTLNEISHNHSLCKGAPNVIQRNYY